MIKSFIFVLISLSLITITLGQITILPARGTPPPDLSLENQTYATPLDFPYNSTDNDCADIYSIEKTSDGLNYRILIDLKLNGKGCKKVFPWSVAPEKNGMKVYGKQALMTCNTNDPDSSCLPINSGPAGGISLSFDPPIYAFPLIVPQNTPRIPFGYAGYFSYDISQKGSCSDYGYVNKNTQMVTRVNTISHRGIYLTFPTDNQCETLPSQNSFLSALSARTVAERVFVSQSYLLPNGPITLNTSGSNITYGTTQMPYGYLNASYLMGVKSPFLCKLTSSHIVGALGSEVFACPMTDAEWLSILPDVALLGQTIDQLVGPNTTSYGSYQRDGPWIPPEVNLNSIPVGVGRCSTPRDGQAAIPAAGSNYVSTHHPINMVHGPTCTSLRALNSHVTATVTLGGFIGISSTSDPFSGTWITSAGFPVRATNQVGNTFRASDITAPGTSTSHMDVKLSTTGGTNGQALNVDMDALRYVLCNGLNGAVTSAGYNTTSGDYLGPLVSTLRSHSDSIPIWPNPFRWTSPVNDNSDCFGCTFPTIRSQKGWTLFDAAIWSNSLGTECGKYQSDHTLWSRILALVNHTAADLSNVNFFAKWNATSSQTDFFLENAPGLDLDIISEFLPEILNNFIPGVGTSDWVNLIGNLDKHACRPSPYPYYFNANQGQQAIPLCSLLQRQLYYQTYMLNATLKDTVGVPTSTPDLNSASNTGIYNQMAPNIWFGVFQKSILDGNSEWLMYMEDTWDRTGGSKFETEGIAQNVTGLIEMLIPVSSVDIPFVRKRLNNVQHLVYDVEETACVVANPFNFPSIASSSTISANIRFGSPHSFIFDLVSTFTPVFSGENSFVKFNYDVDNIIVKIQYENGNVAQIYTFTAVVVDNSLVLTLSYQTIYLVYVYQIYVPIIIGSVSTSVLPIINVESYYTMTDVNLNTQIIYLQDTASINNIGCSYSSVGTPLPVVLYDYVCNPGNDSSAQNTCYASYDYVLSSDTTLTSNCLSSNACPPKSDGTTTLYMNSCGFNLANSSQSMDNSVHFYYDGSSINQGLIGNALRLDLLNLYTITNCGFGTEFDYRYFSVSVCGYVGNAVSGVTRSIPCDNTYLPFFDVFNEHLEFTSDITWFGEYVTKIRVLIIDEIVTFEIIQDQIWFVNNDNIDVCNTFGPLDVFCNYDPLNVVFSLNFVLHFPFTCAEYYTNFNVNENIQISSKLVTFLQVIDDISIFKYSIEDRSPVNFICSNENITDIFASSTTTSSTASTTTHTLSTVASTPNDPVNPFNFINSFEKGIQGILPPCALDFSNVYARPGLLPLQSWCYPFINTSYVVLPNCSILVNNVIVPEQPLSDVPVFRNIYSVYSNFSDIVTWFCQLSLSSPNQTVIYNCTVDAMTGKRYGEQCYHFEDIAARCEIWWNLSCGINNGYQFGFLVLVMFVPFVLGGLIYLFVIIMIERELVQTADASGKDDLMRQYLDNLEKLKQE